MKKILGISLVALFAAVPMMAGAADMTKVGTAEGDAGKVATVSYVKGAYDAVADVVNTKQDQLKVGNTEVSASVSSAVRTTGADDATLVTEKAVRDAITSAVSDAGSNAATAIAALDSTVSQTAGDDGLAISIVEEDGKLKSVTASIASGTYDASGAAATAESNAKSYADTKKTEAISAAATAMNSALENYSTTTQMNTAISSAITDLNLANTYDAKGAAASALADAKEYAKGYADGLDSAMDARVDVLEAANSALAGTYATKTGVENAIEKASYTAALSNTAVTGTVNAMAVWGSDSTTTVAMTGSVTSGAVAVSADANYTLAQSN